MAASAVPRSEASGKEMKLNPPVTTGYVTASSSAESHRQEAARR